MHSQIVQAQIILNKIPVYLISFILILFVGFYQIDRKKGVSTLIELATNVSLEEVKEKTEADFTISGTL